MTPKRWRIKEYKDGAIAVKTEMGELFFNSAYALAAREMIRKHNQLVRLSEELGTSLI